MIDPSHKIYLTTLWAPDIEASTSFYQLAVGLSPLPHAAGHPHFQLGDAILAIQPGHPHPADDAHPADFPLLAITVPDLDQSVARLQSFGVQLPFGIQSNPSQRWVKIYDPAGNLVELVEQAPAGERRTPLAPFYRDYLQKTALLVEQYKKELADLPPSALDWRPVPQANSLAVLAVHITGAYRYWLMDVISAIPSGRDREAEFRTAGLPGPALMHQLDQMLEQLNHVVNQLELEDLNAVRLSPRDQKEYTVGYALLHVYEHTALHLGHVQLTRQLWEAGANVT